VIRGLNNDGKASLSFWSIQVRSNAQIATVIIDTFELRTCQRLRRKQGEAQAHLGEPLEADHLAAVRLGDHRPGPNGVHSGISAGALALTRALQQGQVARNNP
jgi:hypothetical protein